MLEYFNLSHENRYGAYQNEHCMLANVAVYPGNRINGTLLSVHGSLRQNIKEEMPTMIYLTVAVVVFLLVYLFVALIRPEWF